MDIIFKLVICVTYYHSDPTEFYRRREEKRKEIKRLGLLIGGAFLSFLLFQEIIYVLFTLLGLTEKYSDDPVYQSAIDIILIIAGMLVPFYFFGKRMKKVSRVTEPISFNKPVGAAEFITAVAAGLGICMFANIVTSYITVFAEVFGVHLKSPDIAMPTGIGGIVITLVRVVVCAAMTEEITMRGYVMGNLRNYGDKFAILMSSLMFAAMHGNLVQAPFALIAGFAIGYFTVKTGSIWTGIAIHALNNAISVAITYASDYLSEETANMVAAILIYGLIALGALSLAGFVFIIKDRHLLNNCVELSLSEKSRAFILNPAMLVALAYMIYITIQYIEIG